MSMRRIALVVLLASAASGCSQAWPPEARGGMAERLAPLPADLASTGQAIDQALETGAIGPAAAAEARDRLVLAHREAEAGLEGDADANALAASLKIGGADITSSTGRATCLKSPCK